MFNLHRENRLIFVQTYSTASIFFNDLQYNITSLQNALYCIKMCQVQPVGSLRVQLRLLSTVFLSVVLVYYAGSIITSFITSTFYQLLRKNGHTFFL